MKKKQDQLAHTVSRADWLKKQEAERISYAGKALPRRVNWQHAEPYKCPELHHRSAGQAARPLTLNTR